MVNKAEQPQNDVQDVGNTTTDVTEEFTGVDTPPEEQLNLRQKVLARKLQR